MMFQIPEGEPQHQDLDAKRHVSRGMSVEGQQAGGGREANPKIEFS